MVIGLIFLIYSAAAGKPGMMYAPVDSLFNSLFIYLFFANIFLRDGMLLIYTFYKL
jgi:hypothetical protein